MRILFCLDYYYPHVGGAEVLFTALAEGLARSGHQVDVVTQGVDGSPEEEMHNGVHIVRVNTGGSRLKFVLRGGRALSSLAPLADVIHTSTYAAALPAHKAARRAGKPLVLTVHEVWIGKWQRVSDDPWYVNVVHDWQERLILSKDYPYLVAVSNATARDMVRIGMPKERITTIYNGVDYDFWNPARITARPHAAGEHQFFFSGRPGCSKGLPTLLEALSMVVPKYPQARLLAIVSKARDMRKGYEETEKLIRQLKLEDVVSMRPSVPYSDLPSYVLGSDTVVVPSLSEGFGFSAAEACALGRPIIATDNASLPEVVSGRVLLVPPRQPEVLAEAMCRGIRGEFEVIPERRFTLEENLRRHLELYTRILAQR